MRPTQQYSKFNRSDEIEVRNAPIIPYTDTWHPIHHSRCIDVVEQALSEREVKIVQKSYSMSKDGMKAYGTVVFGNGDKDISQTVIWRNSMNKAFSFGVCGGTHAWACTNLMMSGEFVEFRKHTNGMDDAELARIVGNGMEVILPYTKQLQFWHVAMREVKLDLRRTKVLAYNAITGGIIARNRITEFHNALFGEHHEYDPKTLFGLHGAMTQTMRDSRMTGSTVPRQTALFQFIQTHFEDKLPKLGEVA